MGNRGAVGEPTLRLSTSTTAQGPGLDLDGCRSLIKGLLG